MAQTVLMIDDDMEFVEAISNLLDAKGYEVHSASDSRIGIEKAKEINPDLILLDVMMTSKSEGFDAARQIHADEQLKDIPVVMLSGLRKEMNLPFTFEPDDEMLPVCAFLEKPVTPDVLLKTVADNIRK